MFKSSKYTPNEALQKLRKYCSFQERCHQEVKQKLFSWGLYGEDIGNIMVQLIEENYLNEERYAKSLAGSKFRQKGWGKNLIRQRLLQKGVTEPLLQLALEEVKDADYEEKLHKLLLKKKKIIKEDNPLLLKQKLARFAISKGYESEIVWQQLQAIFTSK